MSEDIIIRKDPAADSDAAGENIKNMFLQSLVYSQAGAFPKAYQPGVYTGEQGLEILVRYPFKQFEI